MTAAGSTSATPTSSWPWTVRARVDGRTQRRWQVVGFRNSGELRDEIAEALRSGRALPPVSRLPR